MRKWNTYSYLLFGRQLDIVPRWRAADDAQKQPDVRETFMTHLGKCKHTKPRGLKPAKVVIE